MFPQHIFLALCFFSLTASAQSKSDALNGPTKAFGIKGGLNSQLLYSPKSFNANNNLGFFLGAFYAPATSSRFGARSEVIFSRQGYDYSNNQQTGKVKLDYLLLPQLFTISFTRFLQLQVGAQMAILLNGSVDSSANPSPVPNPLKPSDLFSRFNFGYAAGVESNPVGGLIVGGRYNLFLNLVSSTSQTTYPSYVPDYSGQLKHGTLQFYVGYRF